MLAFPFPLRLDALLPLPDFMGAPFIPLFVPLPREVPLSLAFAFPLGPLPPLVPPRLGSSGGKRNRHATSRSLHWQGERPVPRSGIFAPAHAPG